MERCASSKAPGDMRQIALVMGVVLLMLSARVATAGSRRVTGGIVSTGAAIAPCDSGVVFWVKPQPCSSSTTGEAPTPSGWGFQPYTIYLASVVPTSSSCSLPAAGAVLPGNGWIYTDGGIGLIMEWEVPCLDPGRYLMIIDMVGNDMFDPDCDPVACFNIEALVPASRVTWGQVKAKYAR